MLIITLSIPNGVLVCFCPNIETFIGVFVVIWSLDVDRIRDFSETQNLCKIYVTFNSITIFSI